MNDKREKVLIRNIRGATELIQKGAVHGFGMVSGNSQRKGEKPRHLINARPHPKPHCPPTITLQAQALQGAPRPERQR